MARLWFTLAPWRFCIFFNFHIVFHTLEKFLRTSTSARFCAFQLLLTVPRRRRMQPACCSALRRRCHFFERCRKSCAVAQRDSGHRGVKRPIFSYFSQGMRLQNWRTTPSENVRSSRSFEMKVGLGLSFDWHYLGFSNLTSKLGKSMEPTFPCILHSFPGVSLPFSLDTNVYITYVYSCFFW